MSTPIDHELDLVITHVMKASRAAVWDAWTDPRRFEKWWVPAPAVSRVVEWELRPGGSLVTQISEQGGEFGPHIAGSFLAIEPGERIVFTTCLVGGFRPAAQPFITAEITLGDHPEGTLYIAHVMHSTPKSRAVHEELGFYEGWGTVTKQLADLVEADG